MTPESTEHIETITEYCIDPDCMYAHACKHNVAVSKLRIEQIAGKKEIDSIACIAGDFERHCPIKGKGDKK